MTTYGNTPTLTQYLAMRLASKRESKAAKRSLPRTWYQATIRLLLNLAGFACLTFAGFQWNMIAGTIIAGMSFFAISWLAGTDRSTNTDDRLRR